MKKIIVIFISILMVSPALTYMQAQQLHTSVNAAGGNATGAGGSASYSVGQVFFTSVSSTTTSVAEGVQQPFEISVFTGVKDIKAIDLCYAAYPNPTSGKLTLKIDNFKPISFTFQLMDVNGKILRNDKLTEKETVIDMTELKPAAYFLKVTNSKKGVKIFKIIKH